MFLILRNFSLCRGIGSFLFCASMLQASCFPISSIEFIPSQSSLETFSQEEIFSKLSFLKNIVSFYARSCLDSKGISELLEKLNQESIKAGYVTTKFGLPPQDLKSGILKIKIIVGKIGRFDYQGEALPYYKKDFGIGAGDMLNLKELEFGMSNIKRLRYLAPTMRIIPTPFEGESDIQINLIQKSLPVFFRANLDNGGSTGARNYGSSTLDRLKSFFTSNIQSSFVLGIENPTHLGDTISFYINNSIPYTKGSHSLYVSASYSIPIRRALLELNGSFSQSASTLQLDYSSPINSNKSWSFEAKLSYLLLSNTSHSLSLGGGFNIKDNRNFLDKVELEVQRKFLSDVSLFMTYKYLFDVSEFSFTFSLLQGIPAFGSNKILGSDKPYLYTIPTLDFYLNTPFLIKDQSFNFSSLFKTQISQSDLFASEKMSIGGRASVRGFDGLSLSGQIGVLWRNDLIYYLPSFSGVTFAPALGLDAGYVQDFKEKADQYNFLSGGGVGIKMFAPYFNMELWYYYPIYNPYKVATQNAYFSIGVSV